MRYGEKRIVDVTVKVRRRHNGNPDNGPVGYHGYTAEIADTPQPREILGCPLGRTSKENADYALDDLKDRVAHESGVLLNIQKIIYPGE